MSCGVARGARAKSASAWRSAQCAAVVWMVLREVLTLAAIGLAISLPAALAASKLVESLSAA
jgi:hypothetical protein